MNKPKVSIIIPTLNEEHYIGALLKSITQQTEQPHEVLVVDCGSKDTTAEVVKSFKNVQLLKADKPVGNQRDFGGRHASGEILLFLDADVVIKENFLRKSLREIQERKLDVACPQYIPYPGSILIDAFYSFFNMLFRLSEKYKPSGAGSGIFVARKVFTNVGGFDKDLKFDDIDFIRRASRKGTFGMLNTHVHVSDRRIRTYGLLHITIQYIFLSILFAFDAHSQANSVSYAFGKFKKED